MLDGDALNDKKVSTMVICLTVMFVMFLNSTLTTLEQNKGWKANLEKNQDWLK